MRRKWKIKPAFRDEVFETGQRLILHPAYNRLFKELCAVSKELSESAARKKKVLMGVCLLSGVISGLIPNLVVSGNLMSAYNLRPTLSLDYYLAYLRAALPYGAFYIAGGVITALGTHRLLGMHKLQKAGKQIVQFINLSKAQHAGQSLHVPVPQAYRDSVREMAALCRERRIRTQKERTRLNAISRKEIA